MSLAEVLKSHERLNELFLPHQESLLRLDFESAAERLPQTAMAASLLAMNMRWKFLPMSDSQF
jgi:hypothetical protein